MEKIRKEYKRITGHLLNIMENMRSMVLRYSGKDGSIRRGRDGVDSARQCARSEILVEHSFFPLLINLLFCAVLCALWQHTPQQRQWQCTKATGRQV